MEFMEKVAEKRTQTRYIFATFFILCGLVIGISSMNRHYVGIMPLDSTYTSELMGLYPDRGMPELNRVIPVGSTLHYDIRTFKPLKGLTYTMPSFWWLAICIGLVYVGLGVKSVLSKDWLFVKDKYSNKERGGEAVG